MVWWFTEWSIDESFWQINHDSPSPQLWIFTVIYPPAVKCGWEIPEVMEGLLGKSMKIIKTWREKSIAMFDCPRVIASSFWQIFSWEWRSKMISLWSQITDYIIVRLNMWMKYDEVSWMLLINFGMSEIHQEPRVHGSSRHDDTLKLGLPLFIFVPKHPSS